MNKSQVLSRRQWYVRQALLVVAAFAILWVSTAYIESREWPGWMKVILLGVAGAFAALGGPFTYQGYLRRAGGGNVQSWTAGTVVRSAAPTDDGKSFPVQEAVGGVVLWGAGLTLAYLLMRWIRF